jgi:hypothetical protein
MGGSGRGLIRSTISTFAWREWGKLRNTSISIFDILAEIQTEHLPRSLYVRSVLLQPNSSVIRESSYHHVCEFQNSKSTTDKMFCITKNESVMDEPYICHLWI